MKLPMFYTETVEGSVVGLPLSQCGFEQMPNSNNVLCYFQGRVFRLLITMDQVKQMYTEINGITPRPVLVMETK